MGSAHEHGTFSATADTHTNTSFLQTALDRIPHPTAALLNIRKPVTVGAILLACTLRAAPVLAQQELPTEHEADDQHTEKQDTEEETAGLDETAAQPLYPEGPAGEAFYDSPEELPSNPGDIIWQREGHFMPTPLKHSDAQVRKVLYRSTSALGEPIAVSGTILTPPESVPVNDSDRPLVLFAPGTQGMADRCASSKLFEMGMSYEGPLLERLLQKGYAVGITDYPGLGTEGEHPYVVGRANGPAVLDMGRAALSLPQTGLSIDSPVGIWGYSEGGGAAVWAAQLQETYAPELTIKAVAAGGVPANISDVGRWVAKKPGFLHALGVMGASGLNEAYPELNLESILTEKGKQERDMVLDTCLLDGLVKAAFGQASKSTTSDIFKLPNWKLRFDENKAGKISFHAPIYLYHALLDEAVPFPQAKSLRDTYCRMGMKVRWDTLVFAEHIAGLYLGAGRAMNFLQNSFGGQPPASNCRPSFPWFK